VAARCTSATTVAPHRVSPHECPRALPLHAAHARGGGISPPRTNRNTLASVTDGLFALVPQFTGWPLAVRSVYSPLCGASVNSIGVWGRPTRG
jgi:hypothetical protein